MRVQDLVFIAVFLWPIVIGSAHLDRRTTQLFDFEDIEIPPTGVVTPITIYKGVQFTSISAGALGVANITFLGIRPRSPPQVASTAFRSTLPDLKPASVTVDYPDSPFKSIELVSLYLHYVTTLGTGLFSALVQCKINFECFGSDGKLKAEKEVEYEPDTPLLIPVEEQKKVKFESKFVGCKDIKFALCFNGDRDG
ncbi:uncharacterized protein J4E79_004433 [Alternaria viburni]|uniref:uncharacterized protein n=1 Tax=Alternaria viburni TaxID=566460 RepID=UPI0020C549B8|nr:uncharacterized protein J4E79_004433 [Alternaria viburni]KAI4663119.1 hypothetical protein J4E79_004433 [Alternaria viburni]